MRSIRIDIHKLLQSLSENDRHAFNMLYEAYYEQVFRFAYYFLKDKEACREVVSDVFFSIWQSRKHLAEITQLEAYFYIVTKHEATRYLARNATRDTVSLDEIPIRLAGETGSSPEDQLLSQEMETLLTQAIEELPDKCRIIFLMARQEGLRSKEIAEILSLSESTVRVQMKIAIEKIVTRLRPHFPHLTFGMLLSLLFSV